jgi:hypothetical protein
LGADQTISDEVLAAASEGLRRCGVEVGSVGGDDYRRHIARGALLAAVPHIEAAIRSKIADEIKAESVEMLRDERDGDDVCDWNVALLKAEVIIEIVCESAAYKEHGNGG